jgi:Domain of unknown function (DUF383)
VSTDGADPDDYEYVATILTNVTHVKRGRQLLLERGHSYLPALVSQLRSGNVLRRRGCAAAIRNLCFGAEVRALRCLLAARPLFSVATSGGVGQCGNYTARLWDNRGEIWGVERVLLRGQHVWQAVCSSGADLAQRFAVSLASARGR